MNQKLYLNKFAKVDNIENYTLNTINILNKEYKDFIDKSEGTDPDFPGINFGDNSTKVTGTNAATMNEETNNSDNNF